MSYVPNRLLSILSATLTDEASNIALDSFKNFALSRFFASIRDGFSDLLIMNGGLEHMEKFLPSTLHGENANSSPRDLWKSELSEYLNVSGKYHNVEDMGPIRCKNGNYPFLSLQNLSSNFLPYR